MSEFMFEVGDLVSYECEYGYCAPGEGVISCRYEEHGTCYYSIEGVDVDFEAHELVPSSEACGDLTLGLNEEPAPGYHDKKHDAGKSRPDLIPGSALLEIGKVLEYGARKYAEDSWQTVPDASKRYRAALLRHLYAMESETHDDESKMLHAAHLATNAVFLLWLSLQEVGK